MSLLDVFVIFAYYVDAERKDSKITKQNLIMIMYCLK